MYGYVVVHPEHVLSFERPENVPLFERVEHILSFRNTGTCSFFRTPLLHRNNAQLASAPLWVFERKHMVRKLERRIMF